MAHSTIFLPLYAKQKSNENRDGGRLAAAAHFIKSYRLPSIEYTCE